VAPANDVVLVWQVSHAAVVVMCVVDFVFTSANWPPWQVAQPTVMPVWFIVHAVNAVVFVWQDSQANDVGIWPVAGFGFTSANWPPWQVAQPVVIPVWFIAHAVNVVVFWWQESQANDVGMCVVAGLPFAVVPLWQVAHCPATFAG